ncbi:ABC transporter permease subunit [Streptomyces cyaneofuscatus]|uniref:ABC transporter permease subunit n=1 Tax=Streptomyces cyaneofuscatus TaxID=66883 RepID=UPI0033E85898
MTFDRLAARRRTLWTGLVAATASGVVALIVGRDVVNPQGLPVLEMVWPLVPLLLGEVVRTRRELLAEYAARAERVEQVRASGKEAVRELRATLSVVAQMLAAVVGALVVSGEYSSGTIRTTFAAVPRRSTVFAAKATLVAAVMYVLALLSCSAAYLVGDAMLPDGRYAQGDPLPALFGIAASFAVAAVLGLAVGTLVRHSAGAVTTVIGVLLLPSLFGPLFGNAERWIAGLSPTAALEKLTQTSDATADTVGSLGPWPSLFLVTACTTALALAALVLLRRQDA